jgi:hypothetical protein
VKESCRYDCNQEKAGGGAHFQIYVCMCICMQVYMYACVYVCNGQAAIRVCFCPMPHCLHYVFNYIRILYPYTLYPIHAMPCHTILYPYDPMPLCSYTPMLLSHTALICILIDYHWSSLTPPKVRPRQWCVHCTQGCPRPCRTCPQSGADCHTGWAQMLHMNVCMCIYMYIYVMGLTRMMSR